MMHREVSKSRALDEILSAYRRSFDVVGVCMCGGLSFSRTVGTGGVSENDLRCGDAENDAVALRYVSRMAEVPGVPAHVLTPANAQVRHCFAHHRFERVRITFLWSPVCEEIIRRQFGGSSELRCAGGVERRESGGESLPDPQSGEDPLRRDR